MRNVVGAKISLRSNLYLLKIGLNSNCDRLPLTAMTIITMFDYFGMIITHICITIG